MDPEVQEARVIPAGEFTAICGMFPEFASFWDDPSETVIDLESVAAIADEWT